MINASFDGILSNPDYDGYTVYVHNLSNFDELFLLKALSQDFKINPFFHNNSLFSLPLRGPPRGGATPGLEVSKSIKIDGKTQTVTKLWTRLKC